MGNPQGFLWKRSPSRRTLKKLWGFLLSALLIVLFFGNRPTAIAQDALPQPQTHPLPARLAQHTSATQGDYFDQVQSTRVGYLVWSEFPVKVYVEPADSSATGRTQVWIAAVQQAIQEWGQYLPLEIVNVLETSDIQILRAIPRLRRSPTQVRARAAETRYELLIKRSPNQTPILSHRFTVVLRPGMADAQILAAARHELGHALGIWGHSPSATDALYFSQVRNPPPISIRDVNTLKRVYEQPTRLGWPIAPQ